PPIVRGIEDRLAAAGYVALIGNTDGDPEREWTLFEQMRARHVDGLVLATVHLGDPLLAESARTELPVVLMNRLAQDYSLPSVSVDNERGIRMAVAHPDRAHRGAAGGVHRAGPLPGVPGRDGRARPAGRPPADRDGQGVLHRRG